MESHSAVARKEASRQLSEKIRAACSVTDPKSATIGQLFNDYIEHQKIHVKKQTWIRNEYTIRPVVDQIGRDVLCSKLSASLVEKNIGTDEPTKYNQRLMRVKAMLRWGLDNDYVDGRWISKMKKLPEPSEREKVSEKYLEREELSKLISSMQILQWRLLTQLLALTGMRIGEAIALEVKDVDVKRRTIVINKTYLATLHEISTTKTIDSTREIYIQQELLPVINEIRQWHFRFCPGSKIFFPAAEGKYINVSTFEKYFRENTERIIGRKLTPHSLRHTHASLCFENGMSLDAVRIRLGHADSKITRQIYLHITDRKKEEYNRQMDSFSLIG